MNLQMDPNWDVLPVGVYACDRNGVVVRYNRRAAELWGRSPKLGDPAERFCGSLRMYRVDGAPLPHAQCPMAEALRTGRPVRDQEVMVEQTGGRRAVVLTNIEVLKDASGRMTGAVNCFIDITERKRVEGELRNGRGEFEDFFEHAVVPMHFVRLDGVVLRANQAELDLLGYPRAEYVGRHIAEFHADRAAIADILARLSRGETVNRFPAKLRARDGTVKHVEISSSVRFQGEKDGHTRCVTIEVDKSNTAAPMR